MNSQDAQKKAAAAEAAKYIKEGMTVGLGTGSTAAFLIREAGRLIKNGMHFRAVATSKATEALAAAYQIPLAAPDDVSCIHLAIDGVDEIDGEFRAVKGGGGALLREKIIASHAQEVIWIMDESKVVSKLGAFPFPVEVLPFACHWITEDLGRLGLTAVLRRKNGQVFRTDNDNCILDATVPNGADYESLVQALRRIPGVLETGYFDRMCSRILIGTDTVIARAARTAGTAGTSELAGVKCIENRRRKNVKSGVISIPLQSDVL